LASAFIEGLTLLREHFCLGGRYSKRGKEIPSSLSKNETGERQIKGLERYWGDKKEDHAGGGHLI